MRLVGMIDLQTQLKVNIKKQESQLHRAINYSNYWIAYESKGLNICMEE